LPVLGSGYRLVFIRKTDGSTDGRKGGLMDPFALPRTAFTLYVRLLQFPFELALRLLEGGDDDGAEGTGARARTATGAAPRRRSATDRRRRTAKSGRQASNRRGQASARRRGATRSSATSAAPRAGARRPQATRRGQSERETTTRQREAREQAETTERSDAATPEVPEDLHERIESARGQAAASEREAPKPAKPDESRDDDAAKDAQQRIQAAAQRVRHEQLDDQARRPGDAPSSDEAADRLSALAEKAREAKPD
jgi:hypothetical protein